METGQGSRRGPIHGKSVDLKWKSRCLGGSLIGRIEAARELNKGAVVTMIQKGWNVQEDVEIQDMDNNICAFHFKHREDFLRILRGRPWSIQGALLNLQPWEDDMVLGEFSFDKCPIWVQFHGLPPIVMSKENAVRMGSAVGEVVMIEDPLIDDKLVRSFLGPEFYWTLNPL